MKNDKPKTAAGRYAAELESASTAIGCLQTAIELCQIGDIISAARWVERANEKLQRTAAMPNDQELSHAASDFRQPETRSENCQA